MTKFLGENRPFFAQTVLFLSNFQGNLCSKRGFAGLFLRRVGVRSVLLAYLVANQRFAHPQVLLGRQRGLFGRIRRLCGRGRLLAPLRGCFLRARILYMVTFVGAKMRSVAPVRKIGNIFGDTCYLRFAGK